MLAAATMLAAALVPVPLAPASRAAAVVRASRPVMLVEAADTLVQSGLLVDSVVDMPLQVPLMALGDNSLVDSVQALPPVAQGVYCAQRQHSNLPPIPPAALLARARA